MTIAENIAHVRRRIDAALERSGRTGQDVTLVAVSKTVPVEAIREALAAGITDIGENRAQEARAKFDAVGAGPSWHFIGYLQRNKVRYVVQFADLIQSVDRIEVLAEIGRRAAAVDKTQRLLIEVNVSGEEAKSGVAPPDLEGLISAASQLRSIKVEGLMTMAPLTEDPERVRPVFRKLADIFAKLAKENIPNVEMLHLSMGMTDDFEVALEEGSNMVRIGRAIFAK